MKTCKKCGKEANTDRLLCKECYRISKLKEPLAMPYGIEFKHSGNTYIVTEYGKVFTTVGMRYLTPRVMPNGYEMYSFGDGIERKQVYTHRLVAFCFGLLKSIDDELCIDHVDRNKLNNKLINLRTCTHSENEIHKNVATKGLLYAYGDKRYGPYRSVKDMYTDLNIVGTLGSFYTQVSRGIGFGYTFKRENI